MRNLLGSLVLLLLLSSKSQGVQIDFTPARNIVSCGPTTVYFVYRDTNDADVISWDFGDGTGANINNPAHDYTQTGTYTVKLTIIKDGVTDSVVKEQFVTVKPMPLAQMKIQVIPEQANNQYLFTSQSVHNADSFLAITWSIDSVVLEGPSVRYTFNKEGEYDILLRVTNNKGCVHESSSRIKVKPVTVEPVGMNENELAQVSVYPNPARGKIIVSSLAGHEVHKVSLTDLLGKEHAVNVSSANDNLIVDTKNSAPGIYFLTLQTKGAAVTRRIVIE